MLKKVLVLAEGDAPQHSVLRRALARERRTKGEADVVVASAAAR